MSRAYTLLGADRRPYASAQRGLLGGHRRGHGYGRTDCPAARAALVRGGYVAHRVFFADEAAAVAAGYRPCGRCLPDRYAAWKAGAWPPAELADGEVRLRLTPRAPFAAERLAAYLAARAVPGVEVVAGTTYARTLGLPGGPATVALDLGADGVDVRLRLGAAADLPEAVRRCRALLDEDGPTPAAVERRLGRDALLGPLLRARPGLRAAGTLDAADLALRAVVHQQVSLAGARTVLGRLATAHGAPLPAALRHPALTHLAPTPVELAGADPATLGLPRARAAALVGLAGALAGGDASPRDPASLVALTGIGSWTAQYVALRAGDRDAFPAGDLGLRHAAPDVDLAAAAERCGRCAATAPTTCGTTCPRAGRRARPQPSVAGTRPPDHGPRAGAGAPPVPQHTARRPAASSSAAAPSRCRGRPPAWTPVRRPGAG